MSGLRCEEVLGRSLRHTALWPSMLTFLSRRLSIPRLAALAAEQPAERESTDHIRLWWRLRDLLWTVPDTDEVAAGQEWFSGLHWMIARTSRLTLAAKAGHNGEMHNHDDVGNFIVHVGDESLVADLGREVYSRSYFDPTTRYNHLLASSRGHSVPVPNGQMQGTGAEFRATDVVAEADSLAMQLRDAYPRQAELRSLHRGVPLHRDRGEIELRDEVRFIGGLARPYHCPLVTLSDVMVTADTVVLQGRTEALLVR